jgi:hypothetical protein
MEEAPDNSAVLLFGTPLLPSKHHLGSVHAKLNTNSIADRASSDLSTGGRFASMNAAYCGQ